MKSETAVHPTSTAHHRFHLLDAMRGVAALLVILWHAPKEFYSNLHHSTYLAVDFFFCLSGFVIAFSYERRLQSVMSLRDFIAARVIRLYPVLLIGTVAGFLSFLALDRHHFLSPPSLARILSVFLLQLLMLPDYVLSLNTFAFPFDYPGWSIFFEMLANIAFALLIRAKFSKTWQLLVLLCAPAFFLWRHVSEPRHLDLGWSNDPHQFPYGLARVTLSFLVGVIALRLYRGRVQAPQTWRWHSGFALPLTALLVIIFQTPLAFLRTDAAYLIDLLFLFPFIVYLGAHVAIPALWRPLCAFLGDISYPIYLLNIPITRDLDWLLSRIVARHGDLTQAHPTATLFLFLTLSFSLSLTLAYFAIKYLDQPLRNLMKNRYNAWTKVRAA